MSQRFEWRASTMLLASPFAVAAVARAGRLLPAGSAPAGSIANMAGAYGFQLRLIAAFAAAFALAFLIASILRRKPQLQFLVEFLLAAAVLITVGTY